MRKFRGILLAIGFFFVLSVGADTQTDSFRSFSSIIDIPSAASWPVLHNGRIKPLLALSRETTLFLTGRYGFQGLSSEQFFWGVMAYPDADQVPCIEVRFPALRAELDLPADRRHFSFKELTSTTLQQRAEPIAEKEKVSKRSLTELERKTLETMEQMWLFQSLQSGSFLLSVMGAQDQESNVPAGHAPIGGSEARSLISEFLGALSERSASTQTVVEEKILSRLQALEWPTELRSQLENVSLEVFYLRMQPFHWAMILYALIGALAFSPFLERLKRPVQAGIAVLPFLLMVAGFCFRIRITGFSPVTSMYGTMLWVSLGSSFFGWCFFLLYRNRQILGLTFLTAAALLLMTDQIPLILSPDMDPIVAVLRSNLWLTIHVLTITVSYAAFSLAMILGNSAMVLLLLGRLTKEWIKTYSHLCYRAIQLGVFLLSIGIILGGIWADYSWGRFWGWDPKETWALIADLGFLVLLHARLVGWVDGVKLLILSPISYLLVIMAWYGVNFILATGLHSYGFSSGGTQIVIGFLTVQLLLFLTASALWLRGLKNQQ